MDGMNLMVSTIEVKNQERLLNILVMQQASLCNSSIRTLPNGLFIVQPGHFTSFCIMKNCLSGKIEKHINTYNVTGLLMVASVSLIPCIALYSVGKSM